VSLANGKQASADAAGCRYTATVARTEATMAKGRPLHIAVIIPHLPSAGG